MDYPKDSGLLMLKISIITVVFNRVDVISDALESVQSQTYGNVEHVIIDGGSTDGTIQKIKDCQNKNHIFLSESDGGIYDALNKGFSISSGDVIGILHSDDFFSAPQTLEKIAGLFSEETYDVVYGDLNYVSKNNLNKIIRRWRAGMFSYPRLAWGWMPPHPTLFVRRSAFERLQGFNLQYSISADYDFLIRLFSIPGISAAYIPSVICNMRLGGESNGSLKKIWIKSFEDYLIIRRNNIGGLLTLFSKNLRKIPQFLF